AQHATHAVNAGKDVYCEKPMAEDMYSANMLLDAVNAKRKAGFAPGAVLQIGSQRRSGPAYHAAKAFLESGRFGKLTYVDLCWNVNQNRRWRRDEKLVASLKKEDIDWNLWLLDRDPSKYEFDPRKYLEFRLFWPFSSGIPGQWMCHQIDTVGWYTGLLHPLSAVASGGTYAWNDGRMSFDTFTTILEYGPSKLNDKGFQAVFSSRQTNSARGNVEKYHGPNGTIDLCSGRFTSEGIEHPKKRINEKLTDHYQAAETAANTGGDKMTSAHMYNWMTCVRGRKDPNASVDAGYGHAIALIMSNAACRTGMKATFDENKRQVMVGGKVWTGYDSTVVKCCG
ncbi:MAG: Gfo/Idh/MocA family oxidoreductase, partial [Kiritimatiellae bacterium]|nr:Gfo/Idh/MocA family oxidoreductase [Kiritimatiellia bacterium]